MSGKRLARRCPVPMVIWLPQSTEIIDIPVLSPQSDDISEKRVPPLDHSEYCSHLTPPQLDHPNMATSDLQKSHHLQKSRTTEQHRAKNNEKLKSHPRPKKGRGATFFARGVTSMFAYFWLCAAPWWCDFCKLLVVTN